MSLEFWLYTDGACSGNPGPGGWAFVACARESAKAGEVIEEAGAISQTTNNRMEMESSLRGLVAIRENWGDKLKDSRVRLFTDSQLLIQGATKWIHGWKKKNWTKSDGEPVMNRDLWEKLDAEIKSYPAKIEWLYVAGHAGIEGNERVDELAVAHSKNLSPSLYRGPLGTYSCQKAFVREPVMSEVGVNRSSDSILPKGKRGPTVYLSYVGGKLERHSTWPECENRVKGVPGAKFKKVTSVEEERQVLAAWRVVSA